jgi:hypothetical protein
LDEGLSCSKLKISPAPVKHELYIFKVLTLAHYDGPDRAKIE